MDEVDAPYGPDCGPAVVGGVHYGAIAGTYVGGAVGLIAAVDEGPGAIIAGAGTIATTAGIGSAAGSAVGATIGYAGCEIEYGVHNAVDAVGHWYDNLAAPAPAPAALSPDLASTGSGGGWSLPSIFASTPAWGHDVSTGSMHHDSASGHDHGGASGHSDSAAGSSDG